MTARAALLELLDVHQVAEILRMTASGVRTLIAQGRLEVDGRGGRGVALFKPETIDTYADARGITLAPLPPRVPRQRIRAVRLVTYSPYLRRKCGGNNGVYFLLAEDVGLVKIGWSGSLYTRISTLQVACPHPTRVVGVIRSATQASEKRIHALLDAHRYRGEWFRDRDEVRAVAERYARPWP